MKNSKRIFILLTAWMLVFSLAACSGEKPLKTAETWSEGDLAVTARWLMEKIPEPSFGAADGEWAILGLARSDLDIPQDYFEGYGERVAEYTAACGGVLHERRYTVYSRVILAWTAMGRDAADVGGYNLLTLLADYEQTVYQGINGAVFALLALDSGNYEIPENTAGTTQATRELYVDYILDAELPGGGWSLAGGEAEPDITAMALQALAKYRSRPDAAQAVERGLDVLSRQQNENGGYTAYNTDASESVSQVIVALTELGISADDARFVKNGNSLLDRLLAFRTEEGAFRHTLEDEGEDLLATEQAFYALVALERQEQGESSLYTMG